MKMFSKQFLHQISICWYFFVIGSILGNWAVIIPLIKDSHNINNGELGGIMVGVVFGAICVIPIVTKLIEKYGSAITVCLGSMILIICFPIIGIPGNIGILIIGMVLLGFSAGFMDISMNGQAVVYEKFTNNHHLGLFTSVYAIGNLIGALIGGVMVGPLKLSVLVQCLILSGSLLIPSLLFYFNLFTYAQEIEITKNAPLSDTDHNSNIRDPTIIGLTSSDLSTPFPIDTTPSPLISSSIINKNDVESSSSSSPSITETITKDNINPTDTNSTNTNTTVYSRTLLIISALSFAAYFGEGSVGDWSAIYLTNHDASSFESSFGVVIFQLFIAIGRFYSDYLVVKIGRINLLKLSGIFSALGLIIVSISPIFLSTSFNLYLVICIIGFGLSGCGLSVVYPTCISIAGNCIANMKASEAIAFVSSIGYVGVMVGPPVLGGLSLVISLRYSFLFDGVILALMTVLAFFL